MFSLLLDDLIVGLIIIFVNVKLFPPRLMWSKEQVSDMLLLSRIRELEIFSWLHATMPTRESGRVWGRQV